MHLNIITCCFFNWVAHSPQETAGKKVLFYQSIREITTLQVRHLSRQSEKNLSTLFNDENRWNVSDKSMVKTDPFRLIHISRYLIKNYNSYASTIMHL